MKRAQGQAIESAGDLHPYALTLSEASGWRVGCWKRSRSNMQNLALSTTRGPIIEDFC